MEALAKPFIVISPGWWMGVLHIPLLSISVYAFVLGISRKECNTT
jgi:hypothetical protein